MISDSFLWELLFFSLAIAGVLWASDSVVKHASKLSKRLGMSELLVGLTVVAFGTSAPEFAVSVYASLQGNGEIALGNIVGSNIFNIGIILAIVAIYQPLKVSRSLFARESLLLVAAAGLLVLFSVSNNALSRLEGAALALLLFGYLYSTFLRKSKKGADEEEALSQEAEEVVEEGASGRWAILKDLGLLLLSLGVLIGSSKVIVEIAVSAAASFGVSEWVIGATIIAAGTSLPELATVLASLRLKKANVGIGNILGSELFNILGVIGLSAFVMPITLTQDVTPLLLMLATILMLVFFMRRGWKLNRVEGAILLAFALFRWSMFF